MLINKERLKEFFLEFNGFDRKGKLISKNNYDYSLLREMIFRGEIEGYVADEIGIKLIKK